MRSACCWHSQLDYEPLPASLVVQIRNTWKTRIKGTPAM